MEKHSPIRYKHVGDKLIKTTYDVYKGICPYCGYDGDKSPYKVRKTNEGELVQRFHCPSCDHTFTGDKFGFSRKPVEPISIEVIEGVGTCPKCKSVNKSFSSGSRKYYSCENEKNIIYRYLRCRECGYKARYEKFGVKE